MVDKRHIILFLENASVL